MYADIINVCFNYRVIAKVELISVFLACQWTIGILAYDLKLIMLRIISSMVWICTANFNMHSPTTKVESIPTFANSQLHVADPMFLCSRASDFGLMKIDDTGRVLSFSEKPKGDDLKAMVAIQTQIIELHSQFKVKQIGIMCKNYAIHASGS